MTNKAQKQTLYQQARDLAILLLIAGLIRTFGFGLYQVPTGSMETTMLVGERFFADKFTILFSSPKRGDIITFNDPLYNYSNNPIKNLFQRYVWGPANWTKRVIGIPGDVVRGALEDGRTVIYVNGQKVDEPYLNKYPLIPISTLGRLRPYDPSSPLDKQPFYKIDEFDVKKAQRWHENHGYRSIYYPGTPLPEGHGSDVFEVKLGKNQYWVMGDNRLGSSDSRKWGPLDGSLIHGKILFRIFSIDTDETWWILDLIKHPISFWSDVRWSRCFQLVR